jgi:hypothetical protein
MIITRLIGGLGNQLFQYAAGKSLAVLHNTELKLDLTGFNKTTNRYFLLDNFNIHADIATKSEIRRIRKGPSLIGNYLFKEEGDTFHIFSESHFKYHEEFYDLPDNTYLEGYWQSYKYFEEISAVIREEFTIKSDISRYGNILQEIQDTESVAIHIRLGDYLTNPEAHAFHGLCSSEYYNSAINFMVNRLNDPHFFVFSDDIHLAKERFQFSGLDVSYIEGQTGKMSYLDLYIMSKCRHFIIANSTYSWWSAWLGSNHEKIVIAPKKWFTDSSIDTRDLYLPSYVLK